MSKAQNNDRHFNLSKFLQRQNVVGIWFNKQEFNIDGYKFIRCRFDNCVLKVDSSNFELEECFIDGSCKIVFGGVLIGPIRLFNRDYKWIYDLLPFFAPIKNSDGTITIKYEL